MANFVKNLFSRNQQIRKDGKQPVHVTGNEGRRLLGLTLDGRPIFEPKPTHSILMSAAGGGKTTSGAVVWLQSMLADKNRTIVVADFKQGEIFAQTVEMCLKAGRKVALLDDTFMLGVDHPLRIDLNAFGGIIKSHEEQDKKGELIFSTDTANHALIEEPANDERNAFWRYEPRAMIEYAQMSLLANTRGGCYPGSVWKLLSSPDDLERALKIDLEEGDEVLKSLALHMQAIKSHPEHYGQHLGAVKKALRIFSSGTPLHYAGSDTDLTHKKLLEDGYVVFLTGPQQHVERLGPYFALHLQSFMQALLSSKGLTVDFLLDEFTNTPVKELVSRLTTIRAYGGNVHMIAQSRSEIERKYGEKETLTIEENAVVKQWFGFSSFDEAERVSKAIGEALYYNQGIGTSTDKTDVSGNYNTVRERLYTPADLMMLPKDEQIIHVKDVGFIHAKKIRQNEVYPYAEELLDNPLEGGRLVPTPKVILPTGTKGVE